MSDEENTLEETTEEVVESTEAEAQVEEMTPEARIEALEAELEEAKHKCYTLKQKARTFAAALLTILIKHVNLHLKNSVANCYRLKTVSTVRWQLKVQQFKAIKMVLS